MFARDTNLGGCQAASYGWAFICSECDETSVDSAKRIVGSNPALDISVRPQQSPDSVLKGVLRDGETIDFAMCNPPFFASPEEFLAANQRKVRNLAQNVAKRQGSKNPLGAKRLKGAAAPSASGRTSSNNFEGDPSELWCPGGECAFVGAMARESQLLQHRCLWFSSLVSRVDNLPTILRTLDAISGIKERCNLF
jgi:23S rRNA (adenine1618-N6)-methyltransferase